MTPGVKAVLKNQALEAHIISYGAILHRLYVKDKNGKPVDVVLESPRLKETAKPLVEWFRENKRDLPWRERMDAYRVWISEIMLQQTRVEAVKPYYERFLEELPDVKALAEVREDRLLKLLEGLGYYNRARNLKYAACQIMD